MKKILMVFIFLFFNELSAIESGLTYWDKVYEELLIKKVADKLPELVVMPFFEYPNLGHETAINHFPSGKVLLFGYGSLMNKVSASRSVKAEAVESMEPAIAFGVKRLFNYKSPRTTLWGKQNFNERAMLNLALTLNISAMANGVILKVDAQDLSELVDREKGYDLVPILVASWNDAINQNPHIEIRVAYTFIAVNELRNNIAYTSTQYYPVLGYLRAVQEAAETHGLKFAAFWNATTFLANGTTTIQDWDNNTSMGMLCRPKPR